MEKTMRKIRQNTNRRNLIKLYTNDAVINQDWSSPSIPERDLTWAGCWCCSNRFIGHEMCCLLYSERETREEGRPQKKKRLTYTRDLCDAASYRKYLSFKDLTSAESLSGSVAAWSFSSAVVVSRARARGGILFCSISVQKWCGTGDPTAL